ncbi:MAG: 23S rRNA (guanosine(2251)-2'-O)-methyltransferase RlmB [Candidatus Hydrogenedentes bacterium]|nr:23S rRNA (guanosine(2251)-2'-O)-methyltransferase RlmB [Candidatus Hydrogenedentota bacterium]
MSAKYEIVYGRNPVLECLRARRRAARRLLLLRDAKGLDALIEAAAGLSIAYAARQELDRFAGGGAHQGAVLEAEPLPVLELRDRLAAETGHALFVALDGVEDPQNFGAIVRSASACGASAVIFTRDRAAPLSPAMVKAAAGAVEHVPLVRVTNLVRAIETVQGAGFWVSALDAAGDKLLWDVDLTGRTMLIIGGEGKGVRRLVRERCDHLLRIPITGPITSLNASVSAGIALAECLRQRQPRK